MAYEAEVGNSPPSLTSIDVDSLEVKDGQLIWPGSTPENQLGAETILFLLESKSGRNYTTICLRESSDNPDNPFELVLLKSDAVPDQLKQKHLIERFPNDLEPSDLREVDVLVSVNSGTQLALPFWSHVLEPLLDLAQQELGADPSVATKASRHVLLTQSSDSIPKFARQLWSPAGKLDEQKTLHRTVLLLSGDGGVVDLLNGRDQRTPQGRSPVVALIPLGTGNALFHSLHRPAYSSSGPTPLALSIRALFQGRVADLPVFRASFTSGSHIVPPGSVDDQADDAQTNTVSHVDGAIVASYGFHASLVYESDTPAYRVHGDKRFAMVAQELLCESHPYAAHVEIRRPGSPRLEALPREEHGYVLATLVSNLERTFTISPTSKPLDGQLRLLHFGNIGGQRAMEAMMKAYDGGKHVDVEWEDGEKIYYEDVDEIRITIKEDDGRWRKVCIDGTIVDVPPGGQMAVRRLEESPLQILVHSSIIDS